MHVLQGALNAVRKQLAEEEDQSMQLTVAVEERDYLVAYYQKSENALAMHGNILHGQMAAVLAERSRLHQKLQVCTSLAVVAVPVQVCTCACPPWHCRNGDPVSSICSSDAHKSGSSPRAGWNAGVNWYDCHSAQWYVQQAAQQVETSHAAGIMCILPWSGVRISS